MNFKTYKMNRKHIPIIGEQYGQWIVISTEIKINTNRATYWRVRCKCGAESWRNASSLVSGRTNSCKSCARTAKFEDSFALAYMNRIIKRAEKIGVEYNLTPEYMYELFLSQNKKCALSGVDIQFTNSWNSKSDQTASLDRIDNTKGYIVGNVQWVHKQVNFMKGTMEQKEFIKFCKLISSKCG